MLATIWLLFAALLLLPHFANLRAVIAASVSPVSASLPRLGLPRNSQREQNNRESSRHICNKLEANNQMSVRVCLSSSLSLSLCSLLLSSCPSVSQPDQRSAAKSVLPPRYLIIQSLAQPRLWPLPHDPLLLLLLSVDLFAEFFRRVRSACLFI